MKDTSTGLGESIRHRFPIFENRVYLNSCSQGALADSVRAAYTSYLDSLEAEGSLWSHWVEQSERARGAFARLLHTEPDSVAVTTSASAGVASLASALDFGERDTIVTTDLEFPTIGQIWHAQARRGARVVHVPAEPDNTLSLDRLAAAIDERTAIVSVTHVCFRNGSRLDLAEIAELAHSRGALILADAYQSAGAVPIDVGALGVDFVTGGALKYLLASPGIGYFYANPATTGHLVPTVTGWFADIDVNAMQISEYRPAPNARRFESGTPPIPSVYAAIAGVELMLEIGVERTAEHVERLNDRLIGEVAGMGGIVATPEDHAHRGPLVAIASTDAEQLVERLGAEGIVVSSRGGNLRVSPHCYNTDGDIDRLLAALHTHKDLLRTA
ncbi:aminotransferase class V-fold PLP-dependent enzyme [Amycolatopsis sp. FDAARGOS 1241]|uniref:aminotransferase class V-fold PLP-dependent enzyme n=1 Tax=Amycolatopsis sp. FDAARGOS 1241 TaxID=2778070 RepID=UPI0019522C28|nr:aminotransferase class V-fold PLP-dependent enzyme [Amycolatopsis sp. FDAARGOS 1241]QRP50495.1 aminotransferase class V-fold PLP-dependent enzyme [Amycolatopsis sp. FDAARGOS 1241]